MDDYISRKSAIDAVCVDCSEKMKKLCGREGVCGKRLRVERIPAADVRPVAEISDAVDEVLDFLNENSNCMTYHIYSAIFDLVSGICSSSGADMREETK